MQRCEFIMCIHPPQNSAEHTTLLCPSTNVSMSSSVPTGHWLHSPRPGTVEEVCVFMIIPSSHEIVKHTFEFTILLRTLDTWYNAVIIQAKSHTTLWQLYFCGWELWYIFWSFTLAIYIINWKDIYAVIIDSFTCCFCHYYMNQYWLTIYWWYYLLSIRVH